jgi:phosphoribosylformylglycinamidine synthase II
MSTYRIEVKRTADTRGEMLQKDFVTFGLHGLKMIEVMDVYYLDGELDSESVQKIARELLCDMVVEQFRIGEPEGFEILYNPGVTDPRAASIKKAVTDLGLHISAARTGTHYVFHGNVNMEHLHQCASQFLYNPLVQHILHAHEAPFVPAEPAINVHTIDLTRDLMDISGEMGLSLSRHEMEVIKDHFDRLQRMPTDVELETVAQTWSEHCRHKTFLGNIDFDGEHIENLLKNSIMKVTNELHHELCLSVFHDNSGVIAFDDEYGVCFKVETHNHPSALEPYGGAATGIGGVIRDILGTGFGAKPIVNTDVFCFGSPDLDLEQLPEGILHPHTVIKGVIRGVRDYGNRMGIPTASGAVYFDKDFLYNPLVFCGCAGLIRRDRIDKKALFGDAVILVGGETGRDGIHGVTFASAELSEESEKSCVQIGNPIMEKRVLDCLMRVSDRGLLHAVTDCGGGGLSSAVGEMGKDTGVRIDLEKVPLKYHGLTPREIWISESQERMIMAVPPSSIDEVLKEFHHEGVPATVIGGFTDDHQLRLYYLDENVCTLDMQFLHDGLPMPFKRARRKKPPAAPPTIPKPIEFNSLIMQIVGGMNSCSREWVIREYDHEVQGGSVIKPLVGIHGTGPQDAIVFRPRLDRDRGIALSCGINPAYGRLDAYNMAVSAVDEALRNLASVGGDISKAALLDNFCFSSPEREEVLGDIVLSARGCYVSASAYHVPFISGKDSLYNEWSDSDGRVYMIPPTLLISAIGIIDDVTQCITMDLKSEGSCIYLIGETHDELGGSEYFKILGINGGIVPGLNKELAPQIMQRLCEGIKQGYIRSCHDCSEGGLGLCAAEMAMSGDQGLQIDLERVPATMPQKRFDVLLFSESNTRFVVEVAPDRSKEFEDLFQGLPCAMIGRTISGRAFVIKAGTKQLVSLSLDMIRARWKRKIV